jgi:hypothetical protein
MEVATQRGAAASVSGTVQWLRRNTARALRRTFRTVSQQLLSLHAVWDISHSELHSAGVDIESRGPVVNSPASYSGGSGFKFRFGDCGVPQSLLGKAITASFHIVFNSAFTYRLFIRRYIIWVTQQVSLNKLQINRFKMIDSLLRYSACSLVELDRRFRGAYCVNHQGDSGSTHVWNVGLLQRDSTARCSIKLPRSYSPPWEPETSQTRFKQWLTRNVVYYGIG